MDSTTDIFATAVESDSQIRLTQLQKDKAVDHDLIHYDGIEWKFFDEDIEKLEALKK